MFRILLILLVIALGADALLFSGAYTQAGWRLLQQYTVELHGPSDSNQSATAKESSN
jgi:hypothetical protein